ncbi:MAG: neutral/alkaline non-lysosomal ceramidase N-terminal domain-containing protein [Candidatus Latescibacterota bacterium]
MKVFRPPFFRSLPIVLILVFAALTLGFGAASAQEWQAGVASSLITPKEPLWLAGYGGKKQPSQGTISDLYTKALVLRDPQGNRAVIVTTDIIGFFYEFTDAVTKEASKRYGIPRESILLNASHTHSGPEIRAGKGAFMGMPPEYQAKVGPYAQWLQERIIETIGKAVQDLKPAQITFSSVNPTPFAVCRRVPTDKGIVYRSTPSSYYTGGPRDDTVPVLKIAAPDGKTRAILFGYACHPITLSFDYYSGDYPGFAQQYIQEAVPGATAMFMQGCGGQLVPNSRFQVEYAQGHGRSLADAVKKALDGKQIPLSGPLRCGYQEAVLQFQPLPERKVLEEIAQTGSSPGHEKIASLISKDKAIFLLQQLDKKQPIPMTVPCPLQAISFGKELLLIGIGGETLVDYAVALKAEYKDRFTWVAGYSNYVFGYLPSRKVVQEGEYEGGKAYNGTVFPGPFQEDVEDRVLGAARSVVQKVTK